MAGTTSPAHRRRPNGGRGRSGPGHRPVTPSTGVENCRPGARRGLGTAAGGEAARRATMWREIGMDADPRRRVRSLLERSAWLQMRSRDLHRWSLDACARAEEAVATIRHRRAEHAARYTRRGGRTPDCDDAATPEM